VQPFAPESGNLFSSSDHCLVKPKSDPNSSLAFDCLAGKHTASKLTYSKHMLLKP
jgi:hypothetical protein